MYRATFGSAIIVAASARGTVVQNKTRAGLGATQRYAWDDVVADFTLHDATLRARIARNSVDAHGFRNGKRVWDVGIDLKILRIARILLTRT